MTIKQDDTTEARRRRAELKSAILNRAGTLTAFALRSGIPRARLYQFIDGRSLPGLEVFVNLAGELGFTLIELAEMLGVVIPQPVKKASERRC